MTTKTITVMEDAYSLMLRNKLGNESFSEVIRRVFSQKRDIMEFAGAWKYIDEKEIEEMNTA